LRSQAAYASKELPWALPFLKAATMTHMMRCDEPQRKKIRKKERLTILHGVSEP